MPEIKNATIQETSLGREDHGIMTAYLMLDFGGARQGFGGYAFDECVPATKTRKARAFGAEFIRRVLDTLEVETWEKLPGTVCQVEADHGKVYRTGHFLKDKWFDPVALAKEYQNG